jgi:hypothetical protein
MHPARDWQQIKQQMALELAGSAEGDQALADSKKFGALADEILQLRAALVEAMDFLEDASSQCPEDWPDLRKALNRCKEVLK